MNSDDFKSVVKKLSKTFLKKITVPIIICLAVIIILISIAFIELDDEAFQGGGASAQYTGSIQVDTVNGGIVSSYDNVSGGETSGGTTDEPEGDEPEMEEGSSSEADNETVTLLQLFENSGYNVDRYFDDANDEVNEENLKKILNAQIVTQFPYIDSWTSDKVNGVIRFKRVSSEDTNYEDESENGANLSGLQGCLKYATMDEFAEWIRIYNNDNSNLQAKENAMNHFSLNYVDKNGDGVFDITEYTISYAVLKEAKVTTNDPEVIKNARNDINAIKKEISDSETFKNASYTVEDNGQTATYTFQVLSIQTIDLNEENGIMQTIQKYTMPSEFLLSLLTYSGDLDLVMDVANLAYNSTIVVGIYDSNSSVVSYSNEYTYNKQVKTEITSTITVPEVLEDLENGTDEAKKVLNRVGQAKLNTWPNSLNPNNPAYQNFYGLDKDVIFNLANRKYTNKVTMETEAISFDEIDQLLDNKVIANYRQPVEYYWNCYFYENMPTVDVYIADVWYGYFNKDYTYDAPEITQNESQDINDSEYIKINEAEGNTFLTRIDEVKVEFTKLINNYIAGDEFKNEVKTEFAISEGLEEKVREEIEEDAWTRFVASVEQDFYDMVKHEFDSYVQDTYYTAAENDPSINYQDYYNEKYETEWQEHYDEWKSKEWEIFFEEEKAQKWEEFLQKTLEEELPQRLNIAESAEWNAYYENAKNAKKSELIGLLNQTTELETRTDWERKINGKEKIYNSSNSETIAWNCTSVAAENFHFSKLLQNSSKAYNELYYNRDWFLDNLSRTESTQNVVQIVTGLLNQAYGSDSLSGITDEDLLSLFTTTSVDLNIAENANFTETAKACHDYLWKNNYYYSSKANIEAGNYVQDGTSLGRSLPIILGEPQDKRYVDCSVYVTWVLMQTGNLSADTTKQWTSRILYSKGETIDGVVDSGTFRSRADMENFFKSDNVDTTKYGVILVKQGHTEIFAGIDENGYYCTYNAGSTSSIRKEQSKYTKDGFFNHFSYEDYKVLIVGGSEDNG